MNRKTITTRPTSSGSNLTLNRNRSKSHTVLNTPEVQPSSSKTKSTQTNLLQSLCHFLTDNAEEIGLAVNRQWRIQDFDSLASEEILKIIVSLLINVNMQNQKINNIKQLPGLGVLYDAGMDEIYHKVKAIFPTDDELFHYSVLLVPTSNPKRTKAVLAYIVQFSLFAEDLWDKHLLPCYNEIMEEREEKENIRKEIGELQDEICNFIQTKETSQAKMTVIKNELTTAQGLTAKFKTDLARKEKELCEAKFIYEGHQQHVAELNDKLEKLTADISHLESNIVDNPKAIVGYLQNLRKQCEAENKRREEYQPRVQQIIDDTNDMKRICGDIKSILAAFKEAVTSLENLRDNLPSLTNSDVGANYQQKKIYEMKATINQLREKHTRKLGEIQELQIRQKEELDEIRYEIEKAEKEIPQVINSISVIEGENFEVSELTCRMLTESEDLKRNIAMHNRFLEVVLPKKYKEMERDVEEFVKKINDKFSYYPYH